MTSSEPTVFVVDDDPALQQSVHALLASAGIHAESFSSAGEFLATFDPERRGCIVLDLLLGEENGLDLLENLRTRPQHPPIIVLTAHGTVPISVRAMRGGAIDFMEKPVRPPALVSRIREAFDVDGRQRDALAQRSLLEKRARRLSAREREVASLLMTGKRSKDIATQLGLSVRTVEGYRARLLQKMQADSAPHLVTMLVSSGVKLGVTLDG